MEQVAHFEINFSRILDKSGKLVDDNLQLDFLKNEAAIIEMYRMMLLTRIFDTKAIALQRTGRLGTYPSVLGQEAISIGIGAAMKKTDIFCPYYRECGAQIWRGVKMSEILNFWGGDEAGQNYSDNRQDFPICIPIASQTLHAVGAAMAIKIRKEKRAVVATIGDGGTSRGDFYEAINVAGVWNLPVVFVINNNQWAISVPLAKQTKAETLAQKAFAGGVHGEQIDGNDVFGMRHSLTKALKRAYNGEGPSVIEALTYRMGDHTTADDANRYRAKEEVNSHMIEDPLTRLNKFICAAGYWNANKDKELLVEITAEITKDVEKYLAMAHIKRKAVSMFDHLYAELPIIYQDQLDLIINWQKENS